MSVLADKTLTCRDCGRAFPFTVREQEFYAEKGFNNEPSRCPECRAANKARLNGGVAPAPTASFDRPERQMFPAVCATCGKATQVPFEPRLGRPVYCRDCFVPRAPSPGGSFEPRPSFGSAASSDRGSSFGSSGLGEREPMFSEGGPRERRTAYGTTGPRERGPSFGPPAGDRRPVPSRPYDRRSDSTASYDLDADPDEDPEEPTNRRSSKKRS